MSAPSIKIVVFIDEYGWNKNVPALQDSHGPLYIDQTNKDFIAKLLFRLDKLDLDSLGLTDDDRLELEESIMLCQSAKENWAGDPRSKTKIAGTSGRACDNPVVVIRRILDGAETVDPERTLARVAEDLSGAARRPRLTEAEILAEIDEGETDSREFKSSLRWNVHAAKNGDEITNAAIKTIAGFQNANGGVLYLGVEDDGSIIGVEHDGFENADKFLLHLNGVVKSWVGQVAATRIDARARAIRGKLLCRVDCSPSPKPVYVKFRGDPGKEKFYVRIGQGTQEMSPSQAHEYISEHFQTETTTPIPIPIPVSGRRPATQPRLPTLSQKAQTLLREAAMDSAGTIYRAPGGLGGTPATLLVNGTTFGEGADARTEAAWEAAIEQLEALGLVHAQSYKRGSFRITQAGYKVADADG